MRITIGLAKERLIQYAPSEGTLVERLNLLCEELLNRMAHKGTQVRARFVAGETLTLPWQFSGCLGVTWEKMPIRIVNQWWEMLPNGPGIQDRLWAEISDLGDNFVTFIDLSDVSADGCYLKVISDVAEDGEPQIQLKGQDDEGQEMRTLDAVANEHIWGERVVIGNTGEWTTEKFYDLTQAIKPSTNGRVRIYASATSGDSNPTLVAIYQPDERIPSWRRYKVPTNTDGTDSNIEALCQIRHQWVENDDADLTIGHMGALKDGLLALNAKDNDDLDGYKKLMADAVIKLDEEHRRYHPASTFKSILQIEEEHHVIGIL